MKRKILKILTASISAFLILTIVYFLTFTLPVYTYESSDRGMAEIEGPSKGRSLDLVEAQFAEYEYWKNNPDLKLYRTCKRIWYVPNLWWDNFTNRRWSIPYIEPSPQPNNNYSEQMKKDIQDEYKIYQVVIEERYLSRGGYIDWVNKQKNKDAKELLPKTIIIESESFTDQNLINEIRDTLDSVIKDNDVKKQLIGSWYSRNARSSLLKDYFSFSTEHILISQEQLMDAFQPDKWESFYKRYPKALGVFALSRVAFDDKKTIALVYINNGQDWKWIAGTFYFLIKENEKWKIIEEKGAGIIA
jgi:hypothetical protein